MALRQDDANMLAILTLATQNDLVSWEFTPSDVFLGKFGYFEVSIDGRAPYSEKSPKLNFHYFDGCGWINVGCTGFEVAELVKVVERKIKP